jgi:hypothetical protein
MADPSAAVASPALAPHRGRAFRLGLAVLLLGGAAGCPGNDVWVYVDNGGKEPMVVTVDGEEAATIAPGDFEKLVCQPGERRFHVRCGNDVLFDGTKDLVKSDKLGVGRRYFFNPNHRNRYVTYEVKYGSNPFEGLVESAIGGQADRRAKVRYAYQKLANEVKLLPSEAWFEVPVGAYLLTMPPEVVMTRGYSEKRTVLTRVDPKDYAFLEAARDNQDPSEGDLKALEEVVERVLDSEP